MVITIKSTFSNCFISLQNERKNTLMCISSGMVISERSQRSNYFSGLITGIEFAKKIQTKFIIKNLIVRIVGFGPSRDGAIRGLIIGGVKIQLLCDNASNAHNGCRSAKKRRV